MRCVQGSADGPPMLKGFLVRRRCDCCGTRVGLKREEETRVVLKCPQCEKEYVFSMRAE